MALLQSTVSLTISPATQMVFVRNTDFQDNQVWCFTINDRKHSTFLIFICWSGPKINGLFFPFNWRRKTSRYQELSCWVKMEIFLFPVNTDEIKMENRIFRKITTSEVDCRNLWKSRSDTVSHRHLILIHHKLLTNACSYQPLTISQ